jgi:hypothetical protein
LGGAVARLKGDQTLGVNLFEALQRGQSLDGFTRFLLSEPYFIQALQIEPEFRSSAKKMRES